MSNFPILGASLTPKTTLVIKSNENAESKVLLNLISPLCSVKSQSTNISNLIFVQTVSTLLICVYDLL